MWRPPSFEVTACGYNGLTSKRCVHCNEWRISPKVYLHTTRQRIQLASLSIFFVQKYIRRSSRFICTAGNPLISRYCPLQEAAIHYNICIIHHFIIIHISVLLTSSSSEIGVHWLFLSSITKSTPLSMYTE